MRYYLTYLNLIINIKIFISYKLRNVNLTLENEKFLSAHINSFIGNLKAILNAENYDMTYWEIFFTNEVAFIHFHEFVNIVGVDQKIVKLDLIKIQLRLFILNYIWKADIAVNIFIKSFLNQF